MSEYTPEMMREHLLAVIDSLRVKAENHIIGDMTIKADEKIIPVFEHNERYATGMKSKGFCYTIDVEYLDRGEEMAKLSCPHCCGKLIALQCEIPSGHTHQCEGCAALHAPFGFSK